MSVDRRSVGRWTGVGWARYMRECVVVGPLLSHDGAARLAAARAVGARPVRLQKLQLTRIDCTLPPLANEHDGIQCVHALLNQRHRNQHGSPAQPGHTVNGNGALLVAALLGVIHQGHPFLDDVVGRRLTVRKQQLLTDKTTNQCAR